MKKRVLRGKEHWGECGGGEERGEELKGREGSFEK